MLHESRLYLDHPDPIMSVSDFSGEHFCVIDDFIRLFFLHDHREASNSTFETIPSTAPALIRPELSYYASQICRMMSMPNEENLRVAQNILKPSMRLDHWMRRSHTGQRMRMILLVILTMA